VEHSRFDCFFANSPLPAAIFLSSGIVIGANAAFCSAVEVADLRSGVLGEHLAQVLARYKQVVSEGARERLLIAGVNVSDSLYQVREC
jgi:hypothetical protein